MNQDLGALTLLEAWYEYGICKKFSDKYFSF